MPARRMSRRRRSRRGGKKSNLRKQVALLKSHIDMTPKHGQSFAAVPAITTTPVQFLLNDIVQGDGQSARIGDTCKFLSVLVRFVVSIDAVGPATAMLRAIMVKQKQPNGVDLVLTDVLQSTAANQLMVTPYLLRNAKQWVVLHDRTYNFNQLDKSQKKITIFKRLNMETRYAGGGGGINNIETNGLYLFLFSDQGILGPSVEFQVRTRFVG